MDAIESTLVNVPTGMTVYMLNWGDSYERQSEGPYVGKIGLDFHLLSEEYRSETYAQHEAALADWCYLSEGDFAKWLVVKGVLHPVASISVELSVPRGPDAAYVPTHWPECPMCRQGRGEKDYGEPRRSLNRIPVFYRCTECRHEWAHGEEPVIDGSPMLEDDGRDAEGGCVPFAISQACGLAFQQVADVCRTHGWDKTTGMQQSHAVLAAREMGFDLVSQRRHGVGSDSPPTIKQLLSCLARGKNYILGVRGHWLAVVDGRVVDNDTNSGLGRRVIELYEVSQSGQAAA